MATKPSLILSGIDDDSCTRLNSGSTMENGVVKIRKQLHFKVPPGGNPRQYSDLDVYSHPQFPQKNSVLSADPRYKFYGNASVTHELDDGHYFTADLEYSTENPNATDLEDKSVTPDTPPWKLLPTEINFTYPEVRVHFQRAYNDQGKLSVPVVNSAGDPIPLETTIHNIRMSFTFNARLWNINNLITYGNTLNSKEIKVCGLTIPAERGLLLPPESSYITVYEDHSSKIKWKYWSVRINILFDTSGLLFNRKVIDIGNRAKFYEVIIANDPLVGNMTLPAISKPEQICAFRLFQKITDDSGEYKFIQTGNRIFASWSQFIAFRQKAIANSMSLSKNDKDKYKSGIVDPQCEQLERMFLKNGFMKDPETDPVLLSFREFRSKSWEDLNLPKKGLD